MPICLCCSCVIWRIASRTRFPWELDLVTTDPTIAHGQPTIAGTRILVSVVLDCLAAGMTSAEILAEYPSLTEAGVRAAAAYGAALAREELVPLRPSA